MTNRKSFGQKLPRKIKATVSNMSPSPGPSVSVHSETFILYSLHFLKIFLMYWEGEMIFGHFVAMDLKLGRNGMVIIVKVELLFRVIKMQK